MAVDYATQDQAIGDALTNGDADGLLLAGNGVLCVGQDLEQAFLPPPPPLLDFFFIESTSIIKI